MFRYISLGTSTRVPRDSINGILPKMGFSCITSLQPQPHPNRTGNGGKRSQRAHFIQAFVSILSPFDKFILARWDQKSSEKHVFYLFHKIKGNELFRLT